MQASDGNLYGMTPNGGDYGYGNVFRITPAGAFTNLYSFTGAGDGASGAEAGACEAGAAECVAGAGMGTVDLAGGAVGGVPERPAASRDMASSICSVGVANWPAFRERSSISESCLT